MTKKEVLTVELPSEIPNPEGSLCSTWQQILCLAPEPTPTLQGAGGVAGVECSVCSWKMVSN